MSNYNNTLKQELQSIEYYGVLFTLYPLSIDKVGLKDVHKECRSKREHPLHKYGEGPFCEFDIPDEIKEDKGLYILVVDGIVRYIGKCNNTFKKRISEGYGHISPRNCFKGGQSTNCHINRKINEAIENGSKVLVGVHKMDRIDDIDSLEKEILSRIGDENWNIQH